jgi:hypothetical protein
VGVEKALGCAAIRAPRSGIDLHVHIDILLRSRCHHQGQ